MLRRLRIARDVDSRIGTLRLYADIRERRLGDALEQSSFVATFESGSLDFRDADTGAARLRIAIDAGELRADAGAPVTASITGTAGAMPVVLKAQAGRLRELFEPGARLPFSITAETPAAKLAVSGTAVPQRDPDVALSLALSGERLDGLDALLETSLPPWGPYALTARLRFAKRGYEVSAMRLALGESVLTGSGSLDTARTPPQFDVSLAAEHIRIEDFPLRDWSPFGERDSPSAPVTVETARRTIAAGARGVHAILSREALGRSQGTFEVVAKRVVSGERRAWPRPAPRRSRKRPRDDRADRGRRPGRRRAGLARLRAARADVSSTRGSRSIASTTASSRGPSVRGRDIDGALSLDLRLDATAPRLSAALATGSGRFDFAVWPERVRGGASTCGR